MRFFPGLGGGNALKIARQQLFLGISGHPAECRIDLDKLAERLHGQHHHADGGLIKRQTKRIPSSKRDLGCSIPGEPVRLDPLRVYYKSHRRKRREFGKLDPLIARRDSAVFFVPFHFLNGMREGREEDLKILPNGAGLPGRFTMRVCLRTPAMPREMIALGFFRYPSMRMTSPCRESGDRGPASSPPG